MAVSRPSPSQATVNSISMAWRLGWTRMLSWRSRVSFTGCFAIQASRAAWCCTDRSSLPPKPPPTSLLTTFTWSLGTPRTPTMPWWSS